MYLLYIMGHIQVMFHIYYTEFVIVAYNFWKQYIDYDLCNASVAQW